MKFQIFKYVSIFNFSTKITVMSQSIFLVKRQ
jgi:hypothetical protein